MMTLKEAIKHCKDVALSCTNKECALEHFQLLKWLQEYSNMLEKQGEQKSTDKTESRQYELTEFEKAVKQVMEEAIECGDTHNLKADADMLLRLVQKSSWSEEDEEQLDAAIHLVSNTGHIETANWLKSLRPQKQWKPSDEQMDALRYVTNFDYGGYKAILVSLYEQLKKLKE